jgi:hypothetical protein
VKFPAGARTIGELAEYLVATAPRRLKGEVRTWSREQVLEVVLTAARRTLDRRSVEEDTKLW